MNMKNILIIITVLFISCSSNRLNYEMPKQAEQEIKYNPPEADSWMLSNGIKVIFLQDDELPLLRATLYTRAGTLHLPEKDLVIASALGSLMKNAGAGTLSANQLDQKIEELSAGIATSIGTEFSSFAVSGLVSDTDELFQLFSDVVRRPRFEEDRIKLWKGQAKSGIDRRIEDPTTIATLSMAELLYPNHSLGHVSTKVDIEKVNKDSLKALHQALVVPQDSIFAISGAIDKSSVDKLIRKYFGDWKGTLLNGKIIEPNTPPKAGIYLIEQPLAQSTVIVAQRGLKRLSPEHYDVQLYNEIFSNGFGSRLMQSLRVKQGLVYVADGGFSPDVVEGKNYVVLQTKPSSVVQALISTNLVTQELVDNKVSNIELVEAKKSISNSFVFKFATLSSLVNRYALLDLLKFPKDYDLNYLHNLNDVKQKNIQNIATKFMDSKNKIVIVVGNKEACDSVAKAVMEKPEMSDLRNLPIYRPKFMEKLELL
jgi:zinc protease